MPTITAKIDKIETSKDGKVNIFLTLKDNKGSWQKTYSYSQTNPIKLADFKERVVSDIRRDLKLNNQLSELQDLVGKEFNLIV
mgnify:CR=1 FL=1